MYKNEKGFSTVELLIIIVIVGLVGTVGWLVYNKKNTTKANTTVATAPNTSKPNTPITTTTPTQNGTKYLIVTELGVKFIVPESIGHLKYVIDPPGSSFVRFSSNEDTGCPAVNTGSLGTLFRDTTSIYAELGGGTKTPVAHIANYYYYFSGPQNSCSDSTAASSKQQTAIDTLKATLSTLVSN